MSYDEHDINMNVVSLYLFLEAPQIITDNVSKKTPKSASKM